MLGIARWQDTPQGAEWLALEGKLYRAIMKDVDEADYAAAQAEIDAGHDRLATCAQRIWETPKNAHDAVMQVIMRGAITEHYSEQTDGFSDDGTRLPLVFLDPTELAHDRRPPVCDDSAIAHLLDAIRALADLWTMTHLARARARP